MHFLLLPFLVLFSLSPFSSGIRMTPTMLSTYPQLRNPGATTRYYRESGRRDIILSLGGRTPRPEFEAYIAGLTPIARPTPVAGYVEIVTVSDREYFLIHHNPMRFPDISPSAEAYRVTPGVVEQVTLGGPDQMLVGSPIGVDRWRYEYDAEGRLRRYTAWWSAPPEEGNRAFYDMFKDETWINSPGSRLLYPPARPWIPPLPRLASEDLYDYWPSTGKLRSITSESRWVSLKTSVRHFDESGYELKEPK